MRSHLISVPALLSNKQNDPLGRCACAGYLVAFIARSCASGPKQHVELIHLRVHDLSCEGRSNSHVQETTTGAPPDRDNGDTACALRRYAPKKLAPRRGSAQPDLNDICDLRHGVLAVISGDEAVLEEFRGAHANHHKADKSCAACW